MMLRIITVFFIVDCNKLLFRTKLSDISVNSVIIPFFPPYGVRKIKNEKTPCLFIITVLTYMGR